MTTVSPHHQGGGAVIESESPSDISPTTGNSSTGRKRRVTLDAPETRRKAPKVTRACDRCKSHKARCSGTNPCDGCNKRGESCTWTAKYSRGVAKIPPLTNVDIPASSTSPPQSRALASHTSQARISLSKNASPVIPASLGDASAEAVGITSRGSPELESAEIRGQYHDSTSGLTFVHRAWKRLSAQRSAPLCDVSVGAEKPQPMTSAGDWPMSVDVSAPLQLPGREQARQMLAFYFDVCVVTYRCLHRQSVESWLEAVVENHQAGLPLADHIGHAKVAAVAAIFAIVTFRQERIRSLHHPSASIDFEKSDHFFMAARNLTNEETGLPRLESAQARILQVLYLLQTARMNQSWYVFGNTVQIISAIGLHRKPHSISKVTPRTSGPDYINMQCRKRTFWVAYTLDKYLSVVLGRPSHYHDNDIDQDFPDRINDEEMKMQCIAVTTGLDDCYVDGLIAHALLARIIGEISAEIYSIHPRAKNEAAVAARRHLQILHKWRTDLQPHLGAVKPSSLIPFFRRQSIALKLAYSHAIMHASRPCLLGNMSAISDVSEENIKECLSAARDALETVNTMATDGTLFYSLWWTSSVTFCALSIVYIWEIQYNTHNRMQTKTPSEEALFELAESCHKHLVQPAPFNHPSRAYSVILEELRVEAGLQASRKTRANNPTHTAQHELSEVSTNVFDPEHEFSEVSTHAFDPEHEQFIASEATEMSLGIGLPFDVGDITLPQVPPMLNEWQTSDWLEFDSSAFAPFHNIE